jgi:SAM-dependent methyltransferase
MNWTHLRTAPWLDTRAKFVASTPNKGALLDLGSSDGNTLGHFAELRPDLQFFSADIAGQPSNYPAGCQFQRADLEKERLSWPDGSMDAITCMHLVEHLKNLNLLMEEVARLLKPGGRVYFETPHPKTLALQSLPGAAAGTITMNFYDDCTHTQIVPTGALAQGARKCGLEVVKSGISRNWVFVTARLFSLFLPAKQKAVARIHWTGWSAYLIARHL